jgi:glycosyltransferase involved in cell wall biosynthesis
MACGTPVVVSDRSAMPEVVGDSGLLVDPEDTRAWTTALDRLLRNPALAAELAQRGVLRARHFTWERSARATAEVIKRSMSGQQSDSDRRKRGGR